MVVERNMLGPSNFNANLIKLLINVHLLVNELYEYQNAWCNDKIKNKYSCFLWQAS